MLRDAIMLAIGVGIGWILFERPQWVSDAWQWIKHKLTPDKTGIGM
jgi:hypothetical protein